LLALLNRNAGFPLEEPLLLFATLGLGFSLLALAATRGVTPCVVPVEFSGRAREASPWS